MKYAALVIFVSFLMSCTNAKHDYVVSLLEEWENREILFPTNPIFVIQGKDIAQFTYQGEYKILTYIDSIGCVGCKLLLPKWEEMMSFVDSVTDFHVQFLFFFSPEKKADVYRALKIANFNHPVCVDMHDSLNKLNHFPPNMAFQTFLLDKNNKVLAIGNPVHNSKVKELYLKIIQGEKIERKNESRVIRTKVDTDKTSISLGAFNWQKEQKVSFTLKNTGNKLLIIEDVNTSCGCTSVAYSQEPVQPGKVATLDVIYKAEHPEHFSKTITVYCNTESSPITLKISGNAK